MSIPKVGIIYLAFPTKNWQRDMDRALRSFESIDYPRESLELILIEPEKTSPRVKEWFDANWAQSPKLPRVHYIFNRDENIGFAENNNVGLQKARELGCDYIHLTNEDTDVDSSYLKYAVECAESDAKIGAVQSLILLGDDRERINSSGNSFHFLGFGYSNDYRVDRSHAKTGEIGYASGAATLVRVSALGNRPLFDKKLFMYHEDTDLSLDLKSRGYKIVVEPRSIVWHYYEFGKNKINYCWMERNRWVLILSYYRLWTLFLVAPIAFVMDVALSLFAIKNGWFDMKWKQIKEWLDPAFWRWIRARRRMIASSRTVGDRELLRLAVADIRFQEEHVRNPVLEYIGNPVMRFYWAVIRQLII